MKKPVKFLALSVAALALVSGGAFAAESMSTTVNPLSPSLSASAELRASGSSSIDSNTPSLSTEKDLEVSGSSSDNLSEVNLAIQKSVDSGGVFADTTTPSVILKPSLPFSVSPSTPSSVSVFTQPSFAAKFMKPSTVAKSSTGVTPSSSGSKTYAPIASTPVPKSEEAPAEEAPVKSQPVIISTPTPAPETSPAPAPETSPAPAEETPSESGEETPSDDVTLPVEPVEEAPVEEEPVPAEESPAEEAPVEKEPVVTEPTAPSEGEVSEEAQYISYEFDTTATSPEIIAAWGGDFSKLVKNEDEAEMSSSSVETVDANTQIHRWGANGYTAKVTIKSNDVKKASLRYNEFINKVLVATN